MINHFVIMAWFLLPGQLSGPLAIEDFGGLALGETPSKGWKTRNGSAKGIYTVAEEQGNRYLAAIDRGKSVQLFRKKGWDVDKFPLLKWRWRVRQFPPNSDERSGKTNDSAAAIYVLFPRRWFVPEAIKYIWSDVVPEGTEIKRSSRFPMVVIRTGRSKIGTWVMEERNVKEDFERLFKRRSPDPVALGFLTDANATKGAVAAADYDDFFVFPNVPERPSKDHPSSPPVDPPKQ